MVEKEEVNLLSLLNDIDVDKVGNVLKEFEKYEKILDKASGIVMRLNRIGLLPAVIRILGKDTPNLNEPLPQQSPLNIEAKTAMHLMMFQELNKVSEEVINKMYKSIVEAEVKAKQGAQKKKK